ncbi:hypothetical protein BHYA_0086g00090 [Botrytis hyacinthi]|uniref:Uncharacterized protein n=1 Tax=Botrytis hyacinthi TaxID=278943 RepID=A0A4Z1GLU7_9HELO|nr:hypothetical protein BHYA_0086g00090 [Botrytis hyacinthi]
MGKVGVVIIPVLYNICSDSATAFLSETKVRSVMHPGIYDLKPNILTNRFVRVMNLLRLLNDLLTMLAVRTQLLDSIGT